MSSISLNRRHLLGAGTFAAALATQTSSLAQSARSSSSGEGAAPFLWGAATAGHQVEGNNVASDIWLLEQVKPTLFSEPRAMLATVSSAGESTSISSGR